MRPFIGQAVRRGAGGERARPPCTPRGTPRNPARQPATPRPSTSSPSAASAPARAITWWSPRKPSESPSQSVPPYATIASPIPTRVISRPPEGRRRDGVRRPAGRPASPTRRRARRPAAPRSGGLAGLLAPGRRLAWRPPRRPRPGPVVTRPARATRSPGAAAAPAAGGTGCDGGCRTGRPLRERCTTNHTTAPITSRPHGKPHAPPWPPNHHGKPLTSGDPGDDQQHDRPRVALAQRPLRGDPVLLVGQQRPGHEVGGDAEAAEEDEHDETGPHDHGVDAQPVRDARADAADPLVVGAPPDADAADGGEERVEARVLPLGGG